MADKTEKHPVHSHLEYPDGSVYIYIQAAQPLEKHQFVSSNVNHKAVKFKGGINFPSGIIMERIAKDEYSWVMIKTPQQPQKPAPKIEVPNA